MGVLSYLTGLGGRGLAVDLGTANTVICVRGRGVVLSEPSLVAIDPQGEAVAFGLEAVGMLEAGRVDITAVRPLAEGSDPGHELTELLVAHFIGRVHRNDFTHPQAVVCAPPGDPGLRRSIERACLGAGAGDVRFIRSPMAAAIGAGLLIAEGGPSVVADIGAGRTEIAVIARGEIIVSGTTPDAGRAFDRAIAAHCRDAHGLAIAAATAEETKIAVGAAHPLTAEIHVEVSGQNVETGLDETVVLSSEEIRGALDAPVRSVAGAITETLERAPRDLEAGIMECEVTLAGGGSLLQGLGQRLRNECRMPFGLAESPLTCVAVGCGASPEELEAIHRAGETAGRRRRAA